jgi:hypothetical protein
LAGGAPLGNNNAVKNKPYYDALRRVLAQIEIKDSEGNVIVPAGEALRVIAEQAVRDAVLGAADTRDKARRDIADRTDGKPKQQIEASGPDGGAIVTKIVREVVPAESKP